MSKKSMKLTVKAPRGLKPSDQIVVKATKAAQAVIDEASDLTDALKELQAKGVNITLSELLSRRGGGQPTKTSSGRSKRTVLTAAQKKQVAADLKSGSTAAAVAEKFGVSTATVNNIKRSAGLTKPRN